MIKQIIFDLDDTLCDYRKATEDAKSSIKVVLDEILLYHKGSTIAFAVRSVDLLDCDMRKLTNQATE